MNSYKICNMCNKKKNIKFFRINRNKCKKCDYNSRKEYYKQYRKNNRERIREINRKSYFKNKKNKPKKKDVKKEIVKPDFILKKLYIFL